MSTPGHPQPRPPEELTPRSWSRSGLALLAGVGIVALYLAGAAVSGRASILARRPLLDGLAPPTPYRWVSPPPDLAASNKPPASTRFTLELAPEGSQLGAFSTSDGQVNLVLSQGAVPPRSGQAGVEVTVDPVDPATLGPVPSGLVAAGNAYRIQASYQPSGLKVEALGGQSSVGLVYPLLATAVADTGGHQVLSSADGRDWEALASTDTPGTHQVSARLTRTGYVMVGVPPSAGGSQSDSRTRILLVGTGVAVVIVAAALALRLRERSRPAPPGRGRKR
jgi:protein-S-isoprenylcysteine O-methyltransferase Ste14